MNSPVARLLAFLLLFACARAGAQAQVPQHDIDVRLDPASGEIEIVDRLQVEGRDQYVFVLAPWLEIEKLAIDGSTAIPRRKGNHWSVSLPDRGRHRLEFSLSGRLPARTPTASYAGASSGADGAYLPGYDSWIAIDPSRPLLSYRLRIAVPEAQRAVATGKLVDEQHGDGLYRAVFERQLAAEAPSVFAGPYRVGERMQDGIRLRTYFHAELEGFADVYLDTAGSYIRRYADAIGDYPYADFHIISAPLPVGLGFPNLTYVGRKIVPLPFMRGRSLAHEVLHNWWGNGVAVDYARGNWAEGLTTYQADYALARDQGADAARAMRVKWLRDYAALPKERDLPVRMFRSKQHDASQVIGYNKVAFIFHMLRVEIGQQAFDEGLRIFWREKRFRTAGWDDLRAAFERSSGRTLDWFFSQWLERAGAPRPALGAHRVERVDDGYLTSVELLQPVAGYRFQLPVLLVTEDGLERHQIAVSESLTRVQWTTDARPLSIQFDPDSDVFRKLQSGEAPPILRDITLDPEARTVILSGDDEFGEIAKQLAGRLLESAPRVEGLERAQQSKRPLLVITRGDRLPDLLERLQIGLPPELAGTNHSAAAWTARRPAGNPVLVISAENSGELQSLLRPLPHYGGQSYVLFAAGRALQRGIWPITRGALYRELDDR